MLDSYDALKTSVAAWLTKTGLSGVDALSADFISLSEAWMNRELDVREMSGTALYTISGSEMSLPNDFAGVKSIRIEGSPAVPLTYVQPTALDDAFGTGKPTRYTVTDRIIFDPTPDAEYEIRIGYRKRIPALSNAVQTNWLLRRHPDAYLYGALMQGILYFRDDERSKIEQRFAAALDAIKADDKRTALPSTLNATARAI